MSSVVRLSVWLIVRLFVCLYCVLVALFDQLVLLCVCLVGCLLVLLFVCLCLSECLNLVVGWFD